MAPFDALVHHFGIGERNNGHASDIVNVSKMTHSRIHDASLDRLNGERFVERIAFIASRDSGRSFAATRCRVSRRELQRRASF